MIELYYPYTVSICITMNDSKTLENMSLHELFVFSVSDFLLGDKESPNSPNGTGLDQVWKKKLNFLL